MGGALSGARDIVNFEQQLARGGLPLHSSIQYEGTYYKFYFETGSEEQKLFAPVFSTASTKDPISGNVDYFLCMGMNSKLDGTGLKRHLNGRPNLDLVVVLDVSGSMQCDFGEGDALTKIDVAKSSLINGLLPQLHTNDRLAIVTFTESATVVRPMSSISTNAAEATEVKKKISELVAGGGTKLMAGMRAAADQLAAVSSDSKNESRIFYFTDMDPGTDPKECQELFALTSELANSPTKKTMVTLVGIGIDFNTKVVEEISKIKGCAYLTVKHSRDFKRIMDQEFEYFVTLAAQDVHIKLDHGDSAARASGWAVQSVYGSPGEKKSSDRETLCKLASVFPTPKESPTLTKGAVVLVRLKPNSAAPNKALTVICSYRDKDGHPFSDRYDIPMRFESESASDHFSGSAIRKAVLLTRYVKFSKRVLKDASRNNGRPTFGTETGLFGKRPSEPNAKSVAKTTPLDESFAPLFEKFAKYFNSEAEVIGDPLLIDLQKSFEELRRNGLEPKKTVSS